MEISLVANKAVQNPKIFCVGLSRTGTTSLHLALLALGITSSHYPEAEAWKWIHGNCGEKTTRSYRGYSDIPVAIYYKELYKSHPNAKFILTVRNKDAWTESVGKHFRSTRESSQLTIFRDYFRLAAYGSLVYSKDRFVDKYLRHNDEVSEFFAAKGEQFLLIDLDQGFNWKTLCGFLKVPEPNLKFPHATTPYLGELLHVDGRKIKKTMKLVHHIFRVEE